MLFFWLSKIRGMRKIDEGLLDVSFKPIPKLPGLLRHNKNQHFCFKGKLLFISLYTWGVCDGILKSNYMI